MMTALVIGGAFAGITSAGRLADLFAEVIVLERDPVAATEADALALLEGLQADMQVAVEEGKRRRGVPQFLHCHGWLAGGLESLERVFIGYVADTVKFGAVLPNKGDVWTISGAKKVELPLTAKTSFHGLQGTRALHEGVLRWRLLRDKPNVTIRSRATVEELTFGPVAGGTGTAVTGVVLANGERIAADLVVDASGHRAFAKHWLQAGGFRIPQEVVVNQRSAWTTRFFKVQGWEKLPWSRIFNRPAFPGRRGAVFMRVEGERWMLCHNGLNGDHSSTNLQAFDEFTQSLATDDIWKVVKDAQPLSLPSTYKGAANALRRYDAMRLPERFVIVGDAFAVLNPRFGNGMTVAALQAEALDTALREHLRDQRLEKPSQQGLIGLSTRYHKAAGELARFPFTLITSWDLMYEGTVGDRRLAWKERLWAAYVSHVREVSDSYAPAWQALEGVIQMLKPPQALLAPKIILKVAMYALRKHILKPAQSWLGFWMKGSGFRV